MSKNSQHVLHDNYTASIVHELITFNNSLSFNQSDESEHPWPVPDIGEKEFNIALLIIIWAVWFL